MKISSTFHAPLDFDGINRAALGAYPELLRRWFPQGRVQGREFKVGDINGNSGRSLSINTRTGVWSDFAGDEGGSDPISLYAAHFGLTQGEAARRLADELRLPPTGTGGAHAPADGVNIGPNGNQNPPSQDWQPVLPAPVARPDHIEHPRHGKPSAAWIYRDAEGQVLFLTARFDPPGGKKEILPLTYGSLNGREGWHWKSAPKPRPLYGLDELSRRPRARVLLVEGEKCVHAARQLLPAAVAVTWPGGCKAISTTDWSVLKDRECWYWPDADPEGEQSVPVLAERLRGLVKGLRVIQPPEGMKKGWDLADALAEGWDTEKITEWMKDHMTNPFANVTSMVSADAISTWPAPEWSLATEFRSPPPDFPLECLGEFWADWTQRQAKAKSAPVDFVAGALLATAAGVIGNARWVSPWPEWSESCVLWMGLIGPPSSGKSPGMDSPLGIVRKIENELAAQYPDTLREWEAKQEYAKAREAAWKDEVKDAVKKKVAPPNKPDDAIVPEKPQRPRIRVMDPSIEALGKLLAQLPRGLLFHRDELAGWIGNFDRYGGNGGDRPFWVEAFGGRSYVIDRIKHDEPITISHLSVSILGGIQPDKLRSLLTTGDDDGLPSRFLFLWPQTVPPEAPSISVDNSRAMSAFNRLYELQMSMDDHGNPSPLCIRLSSEASQVFQDWRLRNYASESDAMGLYASHVGKLPGLLLRLALVFEYLRWSVGGDSEPDKIGTSAVGYAAHLVDEYFKPMAVRVYGDAALPEDEAHAAAIARRIRKEGYQLINASKIRREWNIPGLKSADAVRAALRVLEDESWIRPAPTRKGERPGRQSSDYEVNPRAVGTTA